MRVQTFSWPSTADNGSQIVLGTFVLICLPLLMVFPKSAGWLSGILAIAGFVTIVRYREVYPLDWRFLAICLILPLAYIWNMAITGWEQGYLERPLHLLWAFVLYCLIGRYGIRRNALFYGACLGAFAALGIALYEAVYLGNERVFGLQQRWNAVPFGNFSMLFGFFCLSGAFFSSSSERKPLLHFVLAIAGFISGLAASVLSGTRGGWIALPFLVVLCIFMNDRLSRKTRGIMLMLTVVSAMTIFLSSDRFYSRLHEAKQQVAAFTSDPENPQFRNGAVGIRLGMWYWGIHKFMDHPYTGIGIANYKEERKAAVDAGMLPDEFNHLLNLHNEMITSLALGGLPSAVALIIFWIMGIRFFYKRLKTEDEDEHYFALCGLVTVAGTALFSMTEGLFGTSPGTKAIMLCLAIPAGGLRYFMIKKSIAQKA